MVALSLVGFAHARPLTEAGFQAADVVEFADTADGGLRVHYAVDGPSQTRMDDVDADGVPDFASLVLDTAELSLDLFASLGLRPVTPETDVGDALGGSPATDIYLVPFFVSADGAWQSETCDPTRCAGFLQVDHRFDHYAVPAAGVETVVPHELFHGVQRAYAPDFPIWFSEGTATWSQRQFDPDSGDFMGFSSRYLEDVGRPIDRPPGGPVPAFAYGTALFFDHLTLRHDPELMADLLPAVGEALIADPGADLLAVIDGLLRARGDSLPEAFLDFARYNLATGPRAGGVPSYPYAARLAPPTSEERGSFLDVSPRYFDHAMNYLRLDHPGGPAAIWWEGDAPDLHLELYPTDGSVIQPSIWTGTPSSDVIALGDLPAGSYWLLGTVPVRIPESIRMRVCLGEAFRVEACAAESEPDPPDEVPEGCGCASGPSAPGLAVLPLLALAIRRRR